MPKAIVLINTDIGAEEEVLNQLSNLEGVKEAYIVYGVYDIVAKVEAETTEKLKEIVTSRIRKIPKVRSTLTMIIVETRVLS
ncbi:MAG TPA: Lrp/AsnC family transcriptional regulator [Ignisphaera sp.]|uniref:Lrp/AsnC family transcriptional regulator n=1 Tax=Ignisphaera aggregans TaxID=334771 RepID=A0A832YZT1_9CREN|nr:Lrp/AsnC family transcriptional regulator [Ignisphaera sp.]HIP57246.1 Lrp/AsnC family transcriptional regulator [Ignisphaera aggregans]